MSLRDIQLKQKQLLEHAIEMRLDLLHHTEQRRDVTSSPIEVERYKLEIAELKASIEQYKVELQGLEEEIKTESKAGKSTSMRIESYRVSLKDSLTEEQLNFEFQREVKELLELMEYELEDEAISGTAPSTPLTFVAKQEGDFKTLKTLFHCMYGIVDENAVIGFSSIYALNQKNIGLNFAVIITNTYVAPSARALAQQHQIQLLSFEDLLNTVVRLDKYLKIRCRDYEQNNNLFHTYVEVKYLRRGKGRFKDQQASTEEFLVTEAVDGNGFEAKGDLTPYVDAWLLKDGNSQICLLGEYGTGKTSFATQYFYKRALAYMENPLKNRIPMLVTLNRYHKSADIEQLMTGFLVNECGVRRDFNTFLKLASRGKLLIILDGFDEMAKQVDMNVRRHNFKEISRLVVGRNKVILSGRPNYFLTQAEINEIFSQETDSLDLYKAAINKATASNNPRYEILATTLFDRWQIEEFLKRQSAYLKEQGIIDWRDLRQTIYDTYNLEELARTPVLLEIIIKTISEIRGKVTHINAAKLYQIYTDFWMDREYDDKGDVRWLITRSEKELFVSELAWTMLMIDNLHPEIHFSQLSERVRSYFNLEKASEIEYFSSDIRFCSYLVHSASDGNYKFIHKSFMEYFSARYIYQALFVDGNVSRIITDRPITDEVFFFLSQMVGLGEIDLMRKFSKDEEDRTNKEFVIDLATRVLQQSVKFYEHRGSLRAVEEWTNRLMDYSEEVDSDKGRLWGLITLGKLRAQLGQYEKANDCYSRALNISRQLGDRSSESQTLSQIGAVHQNRGEYSEALACYTEAIRTFQEIGDRASTAQVLASVGAVHQHRGEYSEALRCYTEALTTFEDVADRTSTGQALAKIGTLHRNLGEYDSSLECYQRALAIFRELGDRRSESQAIAQLGHMYRETGRYEEAEGFFKEELNIAEELEDQQGISRALSNMGYLCRMTNRYSDAEEWYQRALTVSEHLGDKQGVSSALYAIGTLYQHMKRFEEAESCYQKSISILEGLRDMSSLGRSFYQLANVYVELDKLRDSRKYYEKALELFAELGDKRSTSSVIHQLGVVSQNNGNLDEAERFYRESLHIREQINDAVGIQELSESLGGLAEARQNFDEAKLLYLSALENAERAGNRGRASDLQARLGRLATKAGDEQEAFDHYSAHIRLAREMNLPIHPDIAGEFEQLRSLRRRNPFVISMPVQSESLFSGRSEQLGTLEQCVYQHHHVMLVGERRMGKTSLLNRFIQRLTSPFIPIFIDLQAFPMQAEGILGGVLRKTINELVSRDLLSSKQWEQFSISYARDFIDALSSIVDEAKGKLKDVKIVLVLDEANLLFAKDGQVARVLRSALMLNQDVVAIMAGTSRLLRLSADGPYSPLQNIFRVIILPPFSREETESLVKQMSWQVGVRYSSAALHRVYELSGGMPFYAQIIGSEIVEFAGRESRDEITVEDVNKIVSKVLNSFSLGFENIWKELNEQERATITAVINERPQQAVNKKAIHDLQARQLIVDDNGKYRPLSGLFEEWLKTHN
ncbi:MAG: tetratricopeptide repeat protein [Pyrinomonadaceae bacterium]